ncbi:hypothetical protein D4R78_04380 [bacterium]|nr:MAG: hypothetical protein D4R78_04380 [bacterium]
MEVISQGRRRFPRKKLNIPLRYQSPGKPENHNAVCNNISVGGLGSIDKRFVAPNTPLTFEKSLLSRMISPAGKVAGYYLYRTRIDLKWEWSF